MKLSPDLERKVLELAGRPPAPKPRAKRKAPAVALAAPERWAVTLYPACRVVSESNQRTHWAVRRRRFAEQRAAVVAAWALSPLARDRLDRFLPLAVTLTHVGPRMDGDNLAGAFKGVRDELANRIGVDDGDDRVTWVYDQRTGPPGIEIRIELARVPQ